MNITSELISKIYCKPEWYPYVMSIHCTCVNNAKCPYATTLTDNTQSTVLFDICSQYKKKNTTKKSDNGRQQKNQDKHVCKTSNYYKLSQCDL